MKKFFVGIRPGAAVVLAVAALMILIWIAFGTKIVEFYTVKHYWHAVVSRPDRTIFEAVTKKKPFYEGGRLVVEVRRAEVRVPLPVDGLPFLAPFATDSAKDIELMNWSPNSVPVATR